jgi:hypothetical protein
MQPHPENPRVEGRGPRVRATVAGMLRHVDLKNLSNLFRSPRQLPARRQCNPEPYWSISLVMRLRLIAIRARETDDYIRINCFKRHSVRRQVSCIGAFYSPRCSRPLGQASAHHSLAPAQVAREAVRRTVLPNRACSIGPSANCAPAMSRPCECMLWQLPS